MLNQKHNVETYHPQQNAGTQEIPKNNSILSEYVMMETSNRDNLVACPYCGELCTMCHRIACPERR